MPGRRSIPNLEWISLSSGGKVTEVDAKEKTLVTDFGRHKADVANVIPPQRAGLIAPLAGVADRSGWCPIDPVTFESKQQPGIHVIGDACIAGGMPKSAFSANAQAKVCAAAVASLLRGETPVQPKLINTCYSLVAPDYGISVAGVYRPVNGVLTDVEGAGGVSPADAPASFRSLEATYADTLVPDDHDGSLWLGAADERARRRCSPRPRRAADELRPFKITGDAIVEPLGGATGDAARGRAIVVDRQKGLCLLCHTGPFPDQRFQGTLAPDLTRRGRALERRPAPAAAWSIAAS